MASSNYSIFAPYGGFGNHVRWLLLLDKKFKVINNKPEREIYNIWKGCDWPDYDDLDIVNISEIVLNEMKGKCPFKEVYFVDLPSKIEFIKHSVYPTTRTYHNWLIYEWFFRSLFDKEIYVHHTIESNQFDKTLLLTMNAESAYKSYFKFNSNLNNIEKERFLIINDTNIKSNIDFVTKNNMNYVSFDSSILWNRELDFNFYKELILFFDLDDNYEAANLVHHLWFEGQIRSEQDLVNTVNLMYKS